MPKPLHLRRKRVGPRERVVIDAETGERKTVPTGEPKPLLASKTIITAAIVIFLPKFMDPELAGRVMDFLSSLEAATGIKPYQLLVGIFVVLRLITGERVDLRYWVDWQRIIEKVGKVSRKR